MQRFDEQGQAGSRMDGFFFALVNTIQEWNDNTLSRMPGERDRVVRLRLHPQEGGLSMNMPTDTITNVLSRALMADAAQRSISPLRSTIEANGMAARTKRPF